MVQVKDLTELTLRDLWGATWWRGSQGRGRLVGRPEGTDEETGEEATGE